MVNVAMAREKTTHIRVARDTKEKLDAKGSKGETHDEILRRLAGLDSGEK